MLPKRQHYVPRFYLSGFTAENDDHLYVLDKENGKLFNKNILEICEQNYYYSFHEQEEYNFMLEEYLAKKEGEFSFVFRKLINNVESYFYNKNDKICNFTHNEKKLILEFVYYQIVRVPKYIDDLFSMIIPQFKKFDMEDGIIQTEKELLNDVKKYTFPYFFSRAEEIISILFRKNWMFFILSKELNTSFISSDNPVIKTNSDLYSPTRGALIDPMTEISIPISKNIALALKEKTLKYKMSYNIVKTIDHVNYINRLLLDNAYRFAYSDRKIILES